MGFARKVANGPKGREMDIQKFGEEGEFSIPSVSRNEAACIVNNFSERKHVRTNRSQEPRSLAEVVTTLQRYWFINLPPPLY